MSGFTRPGHSRSLRGDRAGIQPGSDTGCNRGGMLPTGSLSWLA